MRAGRSAVADPRQADVDEVQRLMSLAETAGAVALPELTAAELGAVCGGHRVLLDDAACWWQAVPDEHERHDLTAAALGFLMSRKLISPPAQEVPAGRTEQDDPEPVRLAPALALVIAGLQQPVVVVVCGGAKDGAPRMYGIAQQDRPPSAVVVEQPTGRRAGPFGPVYRYALVSLARAGQALAGWAARGGHDEGAPPRTVDIYRHREGEGLSRERVEVRPDRDGLRVLRSRHGTQDPAVRCDQHELGRMLTSVLDQR
jgi:hypothetical protein